MCGIAGQVRADGGPVAPGLIEGMCAAIEHRGPDQRGVHRARGVGLGIQRLAVIDLRTGDQPVQNEHGSVTVVLNGEIYNYRELRERLRGAGHTLATAGDSETIAHLYEERGVECVHALHGMFAFALWDAARRRLVLARDRIGKKPLYYHAAGGVLSFASELRGLLCDPEVPAEIDHAAIDAYLSYQYVPDPLTAFRGIRKLPPGTVLVWEAGNVALHRYWELDHAAKREPMHATEAFEEVRGAVRRAVRRRMVADVPLGAFLSGGVDSAAVVAAMAEVSPEPVKTFSIGFETGGYDELPRARVTARAFATDHHEMVVRPDAAAIVPRIVRHYGEPFADSSAIPCFYVAEMARRHVTVALTGDGGDEAFGGYQRYATQSLLSRADRLPAPLRAALAAGARHLPGSGDEPGGLARVRRTALALGREPVARYRAQIAFFEDAERAALWTPEYRAFLDPADTHEVIAGPWRAAAGLAPVDRMLAVDSRTYLPGDLLVKMDIATMANSLEARSPLLDHEVLELAASLPPALKVRGREKKIALRGALRGWVPDEILDAPKSGFRVPTADWFRGDLHEWSREILLDRRTAGRGYFRAGAVESMLASHRAGRQDHSRRLWALVMLELWQREFIDPSREALLAA